MRARAPPGVLISAIKSRLVRDARGMRNSSSFRFERHVQSHLNIYIKEVIIKNVELLLLRDIRKLVLPRRHCKLTIPGFRAPLSVRVYRSKCMRNENDLRAIVTRNIRKTPKGKSTYTRGRATRRYRRRLKSSAIPRATRACNFRVIRARYKHQRALLSFLTYQNGTHATPPRPVRSIPDALPSRRGCR